MEKRRGPGRPPSGRELKINTSFRLHREDKEYLVSKFGTITEGLEYLINEHRRKKRRKKKA